VTDVLIVADTVRSPELRHEVPLVIPDPFFYLERNGTKHVVAAGMELVRIPAVAPEIVAHPLEEYGIDELFRQGMTRDEALLAVLVRACRGIGVEQAVVPDEFPLAAADHVRAHGIEVRADSDFFDARRRVKNEAELAGIRRAQRAAEAGMQAGRDLLRRAEARNGGLVVDGEPLTCELIKLHAERAFSAHGATTDSFIASHGAQTAVGHDEGSGPIAPGDTVLFDFFPRDRESSCYADMTRTFVVAGEADEELREWHGLCKEALDRCVAAIRPGLTGKELHTMVCEFFHEHGQPTQLHKESDDEVLDRGFYHATGHGVGLEVHEQPAIGRSGEAFVAGDVLAIEPGLYRPGYGGVRLEDLVLVTDDGAEVLTNFPYSLQP
jgi:Xaa-Pro aminopeptidase